MGLTDIHAHLTHPKFDLDRAAVLERARAAGLTQIVSNGLNLRDNQAVLALADQDPLVRPALGLYPVDAVLAEMRAAGVDYPREGEEHTAEETLEHLRNHLDRAVALGEVGLDGYWVPEAFWERQDQVFIELVQLGCAHDKPLIVHSRKREARTLEILLELGPRKVVWHCYGGKLRLVTRILEAGHYLSIPANVERSETFRRILTEAPRERLLLETDSPYLSPEPGGGRNEPAAVAHTARYAARLWNMSFEDTSQLFEDNLARLFAS